MGLPGFLKKLFGKGDEGSSTPPASSAQAPMMPGAAPEVPPAVNPQSTNPTVTPPESATGGTA